MKYALNHVIPLVLINKMIFDKRNDKIYFLSDFWIELKKVGTVENGRKIRMYCAILKNFQIGVEFLILGAQKGCI